MRTRQAWLAEALEARLLLSAAFAPDPSFGTGGKTDVPASDIQQLSDGTYTMIFTKGVNDESGDKLYDEYYETRLNADGTPDLSFGAKGTKDIGQLAVQHAGGRYFAYDESAGDSGLGEIIAYTRSLRIDNSFSGDGHAPLPFVRRSSKPFTLYAISFFAAADGGVYVHYTAKYRASSGRGADSDELAKLRADGSIDTTFGVNGFLVMQPGARTVIPTTRGIYAYSETATAGVSTGELRRYQLDGSGLDPTFGGGDGILSLAGGLSNIKEQPDGKLLYVANVRTTSPIQTRMFRLNVDGSS